MQRLVEVVGQAAVFLAETDVYNLELPVKTRLPPAVRDKGKKNKRR